MEIAENIKKLRQMSGMSQEQLAKRIGKSRSAVSQYESGEIIPRMGVIEDIADVFNVRKSVIIGESSVPFMFSDMSDDERELVKFYRIMSPEYKSMMMKNAVAYAEMTSKSERRDCADVAGIGAVR